MWIVTQPTKAISLSGIIASGWKGVSISTIISTGESTSSMGQHNAYIGWTLQELLAPRDVLFFNRNWRFAGSRKSLSRTLSERLGIPMDVLIHGYGAPQVGNSHSGICVDQRLSWASQRRTTREEDLAYSLMVRRYVQRAKQVFWLTQTLGDVWR